MVPLRRGPSPDDAPPRLKVAAQVRPDDSGGTRFSSRPSAQEPSRSYSEVLQAAVPPVGQHHRQPTPSPQAAVPPVGQHHRHHTPSPQDAVAPQAERRPVRAAAARRQRRYGGIEDAVDALDDWESGRVQARESEEAPSGSDYHDSRSEEEPVEQHHKKKRNPLFYYKAHEQHFDGLRSQTGRQVWSRTTSLSDLPISWQDNGLVWWRTNVNHIKRYKLEAGLNDKIQLNCLQDYRGSRGRFGRTADAIASMHAWEDARAADLQQNVIDLDEDSNDEAVAADQHNRGRGGARPSRYLYSEHLAPFDALRDAAEVEAWDMRRTKLSDLPLSWQEEDLTYCKCNLEFTKRYEMQRLLNHKVQLAYARACALVQLIVIGDSLSGLRGNALEAERQEWISKLDGKLNMWSTPTAASSGSSPLFRSVLLRRPSPSSLILVAGIPP
ncbi:hypothetical protein BCV69DRAFT_77306 [Microstroma glucosiphilum]|uniref:Uncharacterized protein n=1 Tax=Pseudomicrostroma glucosiphilum TaxID=1684307 RepID=A0A316U104_9BASI|nr:hypothetical protein BCV69DRAFT_77306 [Pseudomicrostroma glucosiphilum]PWN18538.1 hypothetical protein BCV69DRAFT_77306 [Pseudomicrostroma glucosiphilum]